MIHQRWLLTLKWLFVAGWILLPRPSLTLETAPNEPASLLKSLEEIHFDSPRTFVVRDLVLRRTAFTLNFERGRMIFLAPINGAVTGLLFWGKGTIVFRPPSKMERQQLNYFTGSPILNEHFSEAFLRFTDKSYEELMEQLGDKPEFQVLQENALLEEFESKLRGAALMNYRIMEDLASGRHRPMLNARLLGRTLGYFDVGCNQRNNEDTFLGQYRQVGEKSYYDNWCRFSTHERTERGSDENPSGERIDVKSFNVVTQIDKNDHVSGTADVDLVCEKEGAWVLTFDLSHLLKAVRVINDHQKELRFCQTTELIGGEDISRPSHDLILVLLPEPTRRGQRMLLQFQYSGEVISRVGSGVFYVGARGSWYPNTGPTDRAQYRLQFQYPKGYTITATGNLEKEWEDGTLKYSTWTSGGEIPLAGFNYGEYQKTTLMAGRIPIEVFANRNIENVYTEILSRVDFLRQLHEQQQSLQGRPLTEIIPDPPPLSELDFDTTQLAKVLAEKIAGTVDFLQTMLGDFPYRKLSVSQIPGRFGQGWPSLLYVSSLSFLSPAQRDRLGLEKDGQTYFYDCLPAHELAHQWWGNKVVGKSYHDLWITEGFSTYLSYMSLMSKTSDERQFQEVMRISRQKLQTERKDHLSAESTGPVWLGTRLHSSKFPDGYVSVVYEKGAWIFHMLRYLFQSSSMGSEARFQVFVKELMSTYSGKLITTADLQRAAEKHMTKGMDLEGNRKLDWFFEEWVYDTGIPTYRLSYSLVPLQEGKVVVKGKILQEDVSENFTMPIEVFAHFPGEKVVKVGRVDVSGKETSFRLTVGSKPLKVSLDDNHQILCTKKTL